MKKNTIKALVLSAVSIFCLLLTGCNSDQSKLDALVGDYNLVLERRADKAITVKVTQNQFIIQTDDRADAKNASYMFNEQGDVVAVIREDDDDVIILRKGPMPDQWFVHNGGETDDSGSMVRL